LIPSELPRSNKKKYTKFISGMPTLSVNGRNKKMHVCDKLSHRRDNSSYQVRKPITDSPILPADEEHEKEQHQQENGHTSDKILNPLSNSSAADCDVESSPSPLNLPTRPSSPSSTPPSRPITAAATTAAATTAATSDPPIRRRNMIRSARKNNRDYSDNKEDDKIEQMLVEYDNEIRGTKNDSKNNQTQPKQQDGKVYKEGDENVEDDEEEDHDEYNSGRWSVKEHTRLVEAFSKFGRSPPKIQLYVKTRSIRGIETYIIRHYENVLRDSKIYKNRAEDNNNVEEEEDGPYDNIEDDDDEEDHDNTNENENECNSALWSVKEHKRLVEAFSKFGRTPSKLQPYIKTRSIEGIKMYINRHYENVLRDIKKYKDRVKNNTEEDEPLAPANAPSSASFAAAAATTNTNPQSQIATAPKKRKLQSTTNKKKTRQKSSSSLSSSLSSSSSSVTNGQLSDEKKTSPVANDEPTIKKEAEKESKVSMHESETTTNEPITNAHLISSKEKQKKKQSDNEKETESDKPILVTNDEQESKTTTDEESRTIKHETNEE
jgi:hypothetical protein